MPEETGPDTTENPVPTSKTQATCGRVVHVYMPSVRGDVRPAIVLSATSLTEVDSNKIRCNIQYDDAVDKIDNPRTLLCHLYDPLTEEQRDYLACRVEVWAEWPPFVPSGVAKKPDVQDSRVARMEAVLLKYLKAAGANELAAELGGGQ